MISGQSHAGMTVVGLGCFSRGENHEQSQFFLDIEKVVFCAGLDKDHAPRTYWPLLVADPYFPFAARDIINFVFLVRRLPVRRPGRENVKSSAHRGNAKEFMVAAITRDACKQSRRGKNFAQPSAPFRKISVYCRTRLSSSSAPPGRYH